MKLQRFKWEIQETKERRIEVELATATAYAKSVALDAELATKMVRYAIMNEETTVMQKKDDVFNDDITMRLQKLREKYSFFNQEANISGPEGTEPEAVEEEPEEEIVYRPPFQGRLKEGDEKITLEAYLQEYSVGAKVISCTLIYERLQAKRILKLLKGTTSEVEPKDVRKTCAYHLDRNGHTIEECAELNSTHTGVRHVPTAI
ncbi:hypothetical protein AABB24_017208 [Solanum stoloniferum]|uniref:Reverse transcriptase domain-containing protein n=1 Tax=Solanum stoloniferum TaxID=62892 RepID=A0ABD2TJB4_9SOLN